MSLSNSSSSTGLSDNEPEVKSTSLAKAQISSSLIPNDFSPKQISDLTDCSKLAKFGKITSTFDDYVIIHANLSTCVLDTGSLLFLENGAYFGEIYETFGPVRSPYYVVVLSKTIKFKSNSPFSTACLNKDAEQKNAVSQQNDDHQTDSFDKSELEQCDNKTNETANEATSTNGSNLLYSVGSIIYFVPDSVELTIPVFYQQLCELKGSDASWIDDIEVPIELAEFSDDEQERTHRRFMKMKRKLPDETSSGSSSNTTKIQQRPFRRSNQLKNNPNTSVASNVNTTTTTTTNNNNNNNNRIPLLNNYGANNNYYRHPAPISTHPIYPQPFRPPYPISTDAVAPNHGIYNYNQFHNQQSFVQPRPMTAYPITSPNMSFYAPICSPNNTSSAPFVFNQQHPTVGPPGVYLPYFYYPCPPNNNNNNNAAISSTQTRL